MVTQLITDHNRLIALLCCQIFVGDLLLEIDGKKVSGFTLNEVSSCTKKRTYQSEIAIAYSLNIHSSLCVQPNPFNLLIALSFILASPGYA
jgi:hypothetical protein